MTAELQIEDMYPLSPMQQGMLFHSLYAPESGVFVEQFIWTIEGAIDLPAFGAAWQKVIDRYAVLRTSFVWEDLDQPLQVVRRQVALPFAVLDWQDQAADRQTALDRWLVAERSQGFDLAEPPLLRLRLIRWATEQHTLVLMFHHLLLDGWSMPIILKEFLGLYEANRQGRTLRLDRPRPYRDYIAWLQQRPLSEAEQFWRTNLQSFRAPTPLPSSEPPVGPSAEQTAARHAEQELWLAPTLTSTLQTLTQQHQVTMNTLLQGVWAILLGRYSRETDLVFGALVSGRPPELAGVEQMVGLFINTLPVRVQLDARQPILAWLQTLQRQQAEMRQFEYSPLVQVQGWSEVPRGTPLFESVLVFENYPVDDAIRTPTGSLTFRHMEAIERGNDPLIAIAGLSNRLMVRLIYDRQRFDDATISRMLGHLETLLAAIAERPQAAVGQLPIVSPPEHEQLIRTWNQTALDYPRSQCFPQLFEAQAARTPTAIAARCAGQALSYDQLNRRANRLAHSLIAHGVGPDAVVPLLAERGLDLLTMILAVFKAGGAYLPLDPHHPPSRHLQVLRQSASPLVLATAPFIAALESAASELPAPITIGEIEAWLAESADESNPLCRITPRNLAYVIFTSGSTGLPKGAMLEHRGMLNHLFAKISTLELGIADRIAQTASQCFDISVWQFLAALAVGGQVEIYPDAVAFDPWPLLEHAAHDQITILETVPSLLRAMLEETALRPAPPALALRWLVPTGEALPPEICRQWLAVFPAIPLLNAYGPTECSDDVTHHPISTPPAPSQTQMPIGRPVANTQLYILDPAGQPVPIGVAGELCVGGEGVGRGYLRDPGRTALVFVPDPWSQVPGARLYKTGDLARFEPDGTIVFLGRLDYQVKIRGFRIELGEIETVLEQHPLVQSAVVIDREDRPGEQILAAYIVQQAATGSEASPDQALQAEQVARWQALYDNAYSQAGTLADPTFNTSSWDSSYTGEPIPEAEMREYVNTTVARVLAHQPERVLEIGCGTGLLLFRIAPHCTAYCGTDISPVALDHIRRWSDQVPGMPTLELRLQPADDWTGLAPASFDAIVLNSIVQLFPSMDYLVRVLEGGAKLIAPGGLIFIGDVRSLPLLEAFHSSVQLFKAEATTAQAELAQRVQRLVSREKDMAIDPAFFYALKEAIPTISGVQIELKRGSAHNEFTGFRYDVTLHIGGDPSAPAAPWQAWDRSWNLDRLRHVLAHDQPARLALNAVPNARISAALAAQTWLNSAAPSATAAEFHALPSAEEAGIDPETVWQLAHELGYRVAISHDGAGADGLMQLLFEQGSTNDQRPPRLPEPAVRRKPWRQYANNPLQALFAQEVVPQLRAFLKERLPEYMLPSAFVLLDTLPLTPNGKLDRKALPAPSQSRADFEGSVVPPRDAIETELVALWENLLDIRPIGVTDDFFALGGHSILAVRLMSQIQQAFGENLPLATFLQGATIEHLAAILRRPEAIEWSALVPIQPQGSKLPFFCVHPGGGNVLSYQPLAQLLGPDQPFYALQAIGLDGKQTPLNDFRAMATRYLAEIRQVQPTGPYLLGGWCTGGRIAYDIARQLQEAGETVALLAMFDSAALFEVGDEVAFGQDLDILLHRAPGFAVYLPQVAHLAPEAQFAAVIELAQQTGDVPPDFGLDQIRVILRMYQAMMQAEQRHVPARYAIRPVLFRAIDHPADEPLDYGWGAYATLGVEICPVPGNHLSMIEDPTHRVALVEQFKLWLGQATAATMSAPLVGS